MPRTKSLAALIEQYGDDRGYKPNSNKIPMVYKILNRQIFKNQLKKMPKIMVRRMHGALGLFEFNPYALKYCHKITYIINLKILENLLKFLVMKWFIITKNSFSNKILHVITKNFIVLRKIQKLGLNLKRSYQ